MHGTPLPTPAPRAEPSPASVSFAGCSWLLVYHLGALEALRERFDTGAMRFAGASSGAVVAAAAAADVDVHAALAAVVEMACDARARRLGPVGRMTRYLSAGLAALLPADAHRRASGRLVVSVTRLPRLAGELVGDFATRDELVGALMASCYIPVYYERPVRFRGRLCIDGGLTDNCPRLDERTLTVSPRASSGCHVRPSEPVSRALAFFPPDARGLDELYRRGRDDARRHLAGRGSPLGSLGAGAP